MNRLLVALTFASALGSGLMAGFFYAFSVCVMTSLARLPPAQGIPAMQTINVVVINPPFLAVFLGTAGTSAGLAVLALIDWGRSGAGFLLVGALLYLAGTFGVTMLCNVPRNDALARVDPVSPRGVEVWAGYLTTWTAWNHVRTAAAAGAATALTLALWLYDLR